jgi:hypothetical protein
MAPPISRRRTALPPCTGSRSLGFAPADEAAAIEQLQHGTPAGLSLRSPSGCLFGGSSFCRTHLGGHLYPSTFNLWNDTHGKGGPRYGIEVNPRRLRSAIYRMARTYRCGT